MDKLIDEHFEDMFTEIPKEFYALIFSGYEREIIENLIYQERKISDIARIYSLTSMKVRKSLRDARRKIEIYTRNKEIIQKKMFEYYLLKIYEAPIGLSHGRLPLPQAFKILDLLSNEEEAMNNIFKLYLGNQKEHTVDDLWNYIQNPESYLIFPRKVGTRRKNYILEVLATYVWRHYTEQERKQFFIPKTIMIDPKIKTELFINGIFTWEDFDRVKMSNPDITFTDIFNGSFKAKYASRILSEYTSYLGITLTI